MIEKEHFKLTPSEFRIVQELIAQKIGLYYPETRKFQLETSLGERLRANGSLDFKSYLELLRGSTRDGEEIHALSNQLSIRETSFFRNPAQFGILKDYVLPKIIARKGESDKEIRIWSAGCATGQEPYSIAITLLENLPSPETWDIKILATDMSSDAILTAEKGIYGKRAFRGLRKSDLDQYFKKNGRDMEISPSIKKTVTFFENNLVTQPFTHPGMQALDIIFCRNVTIYFNIETTRKVIAKYYSKLSDEGFLFIGHSETLWKISDKFKTLEFPKTFIYVKGVGGKPVTEKPFVAMHGLPYETRVGGKKPAPTATPGPPDTGDPLNAYKTAVKAVQDKEYEKAISIFMRFKPEDAHFLEAKMGLATILANREEFDEAITALEAIIQEDNLHEWAYYHLGVIYSRKGNSEKACAMLNKTLYVNPNNVLAAYHSAEFCLRKKEKAAAVKGFETTMRLLNDLPPDLIIPHSGDLTPGILVQACARQIEVLKEKKS